MNKRFEQLLAVIRQLPAKQREIIKEELTNEGGKDVKPDLKSFLLRGPVFSDSQIEQIKKARQHMDKWRTT